MSETQLKALFDLHNERLDRIQSDVEEIKRRLMDHPFCSAPNTCLRLKEEMEDIRDAVRHATNRVEKLERWQAWLMGIGVVVMIVISLFAPALRNVLGIEEINSKIIHVEDLILKQ